MARFDFQYRKNPHQALFHDDDITQHLTLSGGMGSGKSHALCMKLIKLSFQNRPYPGGLMAPSYRDLRRDMIPLMEEILDRGRVQYDFNRSHLFYRFPWTPGRLYLFTAEKKLRGPNLAYFGINEVSLIQHERYKEAVARVRMRGAKVPQIVSVGTPEGIANYVYDIFVENPMPNSRIIYGNTRDNAANLSEGYISMLEHSFDSKMLDAYVKGLWINMSGNRFYYAYDPARNENKNISTPEVYETVHCSMDFNVDPMTATLWKQVGGKMQAFDQIELGGAEGADTKQMARALIARGYTPDRTFIYPDPAGRARSTQGKPDIEILKQEGFHQIRVKNVAPRFRERQLNVNNLLEKGLIEVNPITCPGIRKDLIGVEQDPITLEKKKNNPKLTHFSDGMDYMIDILYPFSGKRSETREARIR